MVSADAADRPARVKTARVWWWVHQWVGLKLSIFMSFILLTGALAVLSHELDWAMRPALRVPPSSVTGPVNWSAIAESVAAAHPDAQIESLDAPVDRWFAASATLTAADGRYFFAYVHPTTGAYQGDGSWVGAQRIFRNMHRHLNLPTKIGVPIVSALAVLLAISGVTSLVVYKKWWRGFFKPIRWSDARTAWGDVHRLAGVWSLWFVALMAATGLWYLAESLGAAAPAFPRGHAEPVDVRAAALAPRLAASLDRVATVYPDLRIERIVFPSESAGVFQFHGQDRAILVRSRANGVATAAVDAGVLEQWSAHTHASAHQRLSEMADPLHFGAFGGLWTKMIWFAFGLATTMLSVSGVAIYATRLAKSARRAPPWRNELACVWRGMGAWRWAGVSAIVVAFALLPAMFGVYRG